MRGLLRAMGIAYLPLTEVMAKSDIVSIHTPNDASTRGLISREMLALMKPTALLINCGRGPIVDSAALAEALNEGRLAGAGVDVFNQEPPIPDSEPLPPCPQRAADAAYCLCLPGIHAAPGQNRVSQY